MAEFKLGRIRFVWKGVWNTATVYYKDDVIRYGGNTYICVVGHTSNASDFNVDLEASPTKWNQMTTGQDWRGDWATATFYKINDIVKYGGLVYICNDSHTSAATAALGLEADSGKWDLFAESVDWKGDWTTATRYKVNDLVRYGGQTYVCNTYHTSAATASDGLEADQAKWSYFNKGIEYLGDWSTATRYKINDVVKYGAGLWICTTYHTSSAFDTDESNWDQFVEGFEYQDDWNAGTEYQQGDIVRYGGNRYVAITVHSNTKPTASGQTDWLYFSGGMRFMSEWSSSTSYKIGEVVRYHGNTYIATADTTSTSLTVTATSAIDDTFTTGDTGDIDVDMAVRFSGTTFGNVNPDAIYFVESIVSLTEFTITDISGGSVITPTTATGSMTAVVSPEPPDVGYWAQLNAGLDWRGEWADDRQYFEGDVTRYGANTYICILAHRSEADDGSTIRAQGGGAVNSRPDQDITGTYWNLLAVGNELDVLTTIGDMVYYSNVGPTRLPIGREGQVMVVSPDGFPSWKYFGVVDHVYYVATHGTDLPAPTWGKTVDKPWKSIRYACEQVEAGPRNPDAARLLELNRQFIQRETTEWIDYQIEYFTNTVPTPASIWFNFDYDEYKCERDTGYLVDAIIYDIRHGGNEKSRKAALSYVNALTQDTGTYALLSAQSAQDVAGYNYMLTVVQAVLNQTAPAVNYQVTNGDNSTSIVSQFTDATLTAETGIYTTIQGLVGIITDAITAQVATNIPAENIPTKTIFLKTGTHRETLPIVLPRSTALFGDDKRAVNVGPSGSLIHYTDAVYNQGSFNHLASVAGDVIKGTTVTAQAGNTATVQDQAWPYADTTQEARVDKLVSGIKHYVDHALNQMELATLTDPTGYNSSYLVGYGDARTLIKENKRFFQEELIAWIADNYPDVKYSRTACRRDVGYIIDALVYDLTYGGYTQSLNAGLAYYDGVGGALMINTAERTATVEAYARLKVIAQQVATGVTVTASQSTVPQYKEGTAGSAGASTFIGSLIDIIRLAVQDGTRPSAVVTTISSNVCTTSAVHGLQAGDTVSLPLTRPTSNTTNGFFDGKTYYVLTTPTTSSFTLSESFGGSTLVLENGTGLSLTFYKVDKPAATDAVTTTTALITAYETLNAAIPTIQEAVLDYINTTYGGFVYSSTKCKRDLGYILDGNYYDILFGSNFFAIQNGRSYRRYYASEVITGQLSQTTGAINRAKTLSATSLAASTTLVTRSNLNLAEVIDIIENGESAADPLVYTDPGVDPNKRYAREQLVANREFIREELIAWINNAFPSLTYNQVSCSRDIGYIVDAVAFDVQYGGNKATRFAAESYFENAVSILPAGQKAPTVAAMVRLQTVLTEIVVEATVTTTGALSTSQDTSGTAASSTEFDEVAGLIDIIINVIQADSLSGLAAEVLPDTTWVDDTLESVAEQYINDVDGYIKDDVLQFINDEYSSFNYNLAKCSRDVAIILDAVGYDFMFNSNWQSIKAARSYLRQSATEVFSLGQKTVTRDSLTYAKTLAVANVGGDSTAIARINTLMDTIDTIIFAASREGSNIATQIRNDDHAVLQLERNRPFIVADVTNYVDNTYQSTVSIANNADDKFTCDDTSWMRRNTAVRFSGTGVFGGISTINTYYIWSVTSSTEFQIATTRDATAPFELVSATGSMTVALEYDETFCARDTNRFIDALKYDLKYTGNYWSLRSAELYINAVTGSLEQNMFLVQDTSSIRNMTLTGLTGDLGSPNEYGTSRVTAGAYVSLDPGWGPLHEEVWIVNRSCYVQNVATFGYAAIGQKIDGALHAGGNDSIVSNDFTQLISDGIGAWVDNNGRAELVSVFTYYSHIGYLCTNGGRIRGTNGNNSYGDFGAVAEGFDATETPNTAIVDNKFQYKAVVGSVFTDASDDIYNFEFDNAGFDYQEATWIIGGSGSGAIVVQDEFRDDGVMEVRLLDLVDDSTDVPASGNFGGNGYITNSNTAQAGTLSQITIAATDDETSSAYIGMKIVLTGGTGAGQYAIIDTYNSGSKIATVVKESTGASGWDHVLPGTTLIAPDASTTYTIEPRISFTAPSFTDTTATLTSSNTWTDAIYGDTTGVYTDLAGNDYIGAGVGALFNVVRNGWKYFVTIANGGQGYSRLETLVIPGTSLGGLSPTNDITVTITSVNSVTGAITALDKEGDGIGGVYVAIASGTRQGAVSTNGTSWTNITLMMPSVSNWSSITHALVDDGSSVAKQSKFVAVATGTDAAAYSEDGQTWTATTMPTSSNWVGVAYGEGAFVAISSNSTTVAITYDGINWDTTGTLTSTGFTAIAYGMGMWVAVKSGSNTAAYSFDGQTWTDAPANLPASAAWNSVKWGNGRFIAVATDSNDAAYSLNGTVWSAMTLPTIDSSVSGYQKVGYGQGAWMITAWKTGLTGYSNVITSDDGITWTTRGVTDGGVGVSGFNAVAFGSAQRTGRWMILPKDAGTHAVSIRWGARTRARAFVAETRIFAIRLTDPGSGYDTAPTITITDPNNTFEAPTTVRLGSGVLANPTYINRGTGFINADASVDTGDGFADFYQSGQYVAVRRITERPVPGSNVVFGHLPGQVFKLVNVLTFIGTLDGSYTAFFQVSPNLTVFNAPEHGVSVTTRIRYSQVRLTGHDFLDVGTGNFVESNYPGEPTQEPNQANETVEGNGGRVFYTSTDQDGNFRVGELFTIEQSTGIATLNADAFNIAGLQELSLGEVTLGGGSATITEFSTDPFFSADSDSVIPTQRAIKAYISSQIGGGGASLNVNSVTAGFILINTNQITTTTGSTIQMNAKFDFRNDVVGIPLAWNFFYR